MIKWFQNNRDSVIRNSFLLPILLVVIMSISHVVSWYDLGNPYSWAIYLSVAIEIFALASVSASSIKMSRGSIWFLFGLVTAIQIIGNIFFEYRDIVITDSGFLSWVELISPVFEDFNVTDHRRLLAAFQGGTLPLMSLTALHFYIKFNDAKVVKPIDTPDIKEVIVEEAKVDAKDSHGIDAIAELEKIAVEMSNEYSVVPDESKKESNNKDIASETGYINKTDDHRIGKSNRPNKNWG